MKKISALSFPGSSFFLSFFLILKRVLCSASKWVQFAKILGETAFYSTPPVRAAGPLPEGGTSGERRPTPAQAVPSPAAPQLPLVVGREGGW